MSRNPTDDAKARLRESMRIVLADVCERRARLAGEAIADRLASRSRWSASTTIALFATMPGEVDTSPLIRVAQQAGKRLLFPRMVPGKTLEFVHVEQVESLRTGRYGVREPDSRISAQVIPDDALVLVPGYAFDRDGGRLGRGAGYYDRALAGLRGDSGYPTFIGVGFAIQIVESVPMTAFDVRMDGLVTETELLWSE
jgi:5-formyltetrahydrofolate cyclo-ligase